MIGLSKWNENLINSISEEWRDTLDRDYEYNLQALVDDALEEGITLVGGQILQGLIEMIRTLSLADEITEEQAEEFINLLMETA